jgi:AcrR family transcriptional regulator
MPISPDRKQRLLDAAEKLFAEKGFHATSLRQITADAGANLAAVNYHFGSKDGLIAAVFERCVLPVNAERMRLLDEIEASEAPPALEEILYAFVAPPFRFRRAHQREAERAMRLYGRTHAATDPRVHTIFVRQFDSVRRRFSRALARALPDVPQRELCWRLHFLIGTMAQTMADPERLLTLSEGACDPYDIDATLSRLVPFLVAGMRAPLPDVEGHATRAPAQRRARRRS